MRQARMIGNYVERVAESKALTKSHLSEIIGCEEHQVQSFFKGRSILTFSQISKVAEELGVTVSQILSGDEKHYNETIVHCMNGFDNKQNREKILDIIDEYMDIYDAVE